MMTLITGVPGSGKSTLAIDYMIRADKEGRPLFVHGMKGLLLAHLQILCRSTGCDVCSDRLSSMRPGEVPQFADEWHLWAPSGAVIILDEVQHVWRPRPLGKDVPDSVKALETHRKRGIDFVLLTQHAMLVDANVRRFVSPHRHIWQNWARRYINEHSEYSEKPGHGGVEKPYALKRKNFELFWSAEKHTKQPRSIPRQFYMSMGAFVIIAISIAVIWQKQRFFGGNGRLVDVEVSGLPATDGGQSLPSIDEVRASARKSNIFDRDPVDPFYPESAPAYEKLVQIRDFPRVAACVARPEKSQCRCYSQQGTILDLGYDNCVAYALERPFDPYRVPRSQGNGRGIPAYPVNRNETASNPVSGRF